MALLAFWEPRTLRQWDELSTFPPEKRYFKLELMTSVVASDEDSAVPGLFSSGGSSSPHTANHLCELQDHMKTK